jgi:hypothetical protein
METMKETYFQIYRKTTLGRTLISTLDSLIASKSLPSSLKEQTLRCLDKKIAKAFYTDECIKNDCKRTLTGKHVNHNH